MKVEKIQNTIINLNADETASLCAILRTWLHNTNVAYFSKEMHDFAQELLEKL